jgi:hypothetical protein
MRLATGLVALLVAATVACGTASTDDDTWTARDARERAQHRSHLLRVDPDFTPAALSDAQAVWYGRLRLALDASAETADTRAGSDDVYLLGRYLGDYNAALLMALRATGDRRFLDRALDLLDIARDDLRDEWDDGTTDGFLGWRMRTVTSPDYHGRDVHAMDEAMTHGNIALVAYAAHVNRDLSPRYEEAATFWVDYLENDFIAKWTTRAGDVDGAWNGSRGFYKRFTHPRANQLRLAFYLGRITGKERYREQATRCMTDLRGTMSPNPSNADAVVWSHEVSGWNEGVQKVGYAQYMLRVLLDLTWDQPANSAEFPSGPERAAIVTTLRDVVFGSTTIAEPRMAERLDGSGEVSAALYGLAGYGTWDPTGRLLALADAFFDADSRGVSIAAYALMAVSEDRRSVRAVTP